MATSVNVTQRFTFVAFSVFSGALLFALTAMFATRALYTSISGHSHEPDPIMFILLVLACVCSGPIGGSLALLAAVFVLYLRNARTERVRRAA